MGVRSAERITGVSMRPPNQVQVYRMRKARASLQRCTEESTSSALLCVPLATQRLCVIFQVLFGMPRATLVRCASRTRLVLVRARTIQSWHRNSHQAEIHTELRAMVNEMVHHNAADDGHTRHRENLLTTGKQFPPFQHLLVANRRERSTRFRRLLVERR